MNFEHASNPPPPPSLQSPTTRTCTHSSQHIVDYNVTAQKSKQTQNPPPTTSDHHDNIIQMGLYIYTTVQNNNNNNNNIETADFVSSLPGISKTKTSDNGRVKNQVAPMVQFLLFK